MICDCIQLLFYNFTSGDEIENEKRRQQCIQEMNELEKQFVDIKEQYVFTAQYLFSKYLIIWLQ